MISAEFLVSIFLARDQKVNELSISELNTFEVVNSLIAAILSPE